MREPSLTADERLKRQGDASPARVTDLIVIGASAGGHRALPEILRSFSPELPAAIVILLHMQQDSASSLRRSLGRSTRLPFVEVEHGETLRQGHIFVPPPGWSASFSHGKITAEHVAPERPATTINRLFASAAECFGSRVIGVILTGLLKDGTDGLRAVHDAGGLTVVQDPAEAEYPDMPTSAMENLPVTFCLKLADIGPALELLVRRTARFETGLEVAIRTLRARTALLVRLAEQSWRNPSTSSFLEGELASLRGALRSIDDLLKD